jgi:hypothetical protein
MSRSGSRAVTATTEDPLPSQRLRPKIALIDRDTVTQPFTTTNRHASLVLRNLTPGNSIY